MFKDRETGFRGLPPLGETLGLKEGNVSLMRDFQHLADHQNVVEDFPTAVSEVLRERLDPQLRRLLKFGERFHNAGLDVAIRSNQIEGFHTGISVPQIIVTKDGKRKVFPGTSLGEEEGTIWGIIGARFSTERTVIFDAVATVNGNPVDFDNARVVGIFPRVAFRVFFHPDFITGNPITKTVEQAVPPLRLVA